MVKGLIIGGQFGDILVRQKSDEPLELGELLVADLPDGKILLSAFDLLYGSQLSRQNLELVSGLKLEEDGDLELMDGKIRNYVLARLKNLAFVKNNKSVSCKILPVFFRSVRSLVKEDVDFITSPANPLLLGSLRSGSKVLDVPVFIDGRKALSHHVLIAGTTGRGKSVLMSNIIWDVLSKDFCSLLVLDPHNEYFDKVCVHENRPVYYSPSPVAGGFTLKINVSLLLPHHFNGVVDWSDPQRQALSAFFNEFKGGWIEAVLLGRSLSSNQQYFDATLAVVRRRLCQLLSIDVVDDSLKCRGIFDLVAGQTVLFDIVSSLESGRTIIIDTSSFFGNVEILVGSLIANMVLDKRKSFSLNEIKSLPVINIVLEEAPRVLGREVLERGPNVFSTIAREGRKFGVGLTAITQLPSLIPREILANMNTKIILGVELKPERQAIIESAAQDISSDDRLIASLDKGEALITSSFLSFAMPVKIPFFDKKGASAVKKDFSVFMR